MIDEQSVAHGAAEPSGLAMENRSPRPGERRRYRVGEIDPGLVIVTKTPNPYQSPSTLNDHESWWSRFRRMFTPLTPTPTIAFVDGGKIITEGTAFYLDLADPDRLYAASPSSVYTDERMNLVISEAIRVFPLFLLDNPELRLQVAGRKIVVRIINSYSDKPTYYLREMILDWDVAAADLDNASHTDPNR